MIISCKKNVLHSYFLTISILLVLILFKGCDYQYAILLFVWITMMFYCFNKTNERITLLCFGIAFFTFLLGRDGIEFFFNFKDSSKFSKEVNHHAYLSMFLGISGVWISYHLFRKRSHINVAQNLTKKDEIFYGSVRRYSFICFNLAYPFAIFYNLSIFYFIIKFGYAAKFTDLRAIVENSPVYYIISKIELLLPSAFSVYMATLPTKKQFLKIAKPYLLYLVLTLGTGGRGDFILGLLLLIIFLAFMQQIEPNIVWIDKKKYKIALIIGIPAIAIGGSIMNTVRFNESTENTSIIRSFVNFFYEQGVTSNTVKNAYLYQDYIPPQKDYYILEFLHTGLPARFLGNKVYQGNTIDHATEGGSFTHALGYAIMGNTYLAGQGTGSSYLAELYYDFGYIGIFLGSCLYGFLFSLVSIKRKNLFTRSIIFIILTKLLWAPRGGYSGFLSIIFAPTTIVLLLFVFIAARIRTLSHSVTYKINNENISIKPRGSQSS